uniref:Uncharacterized protein n=1 Tax=Strongyloides venezuelensis TaxID=75913 RepID=A0A0K0F4S6_STRVS
MIFNRNTKNYTNTSSSTCWCSNTFNNTQTSIYTISKSKISPKIPAPTTQSLTTRPVGSIGYKYISFFNAKREFGEFVDGYVSCLNDLRRAAKLSEDFLITKIICNIQKKYRTMLKNLTDADLNTIKSLLKDIDKGKSLVAGPNRFFRSGFQSNAPSPTKTTSQDYTSTPVNREIFSHQKRMSTDSQTNNNPTLELPKPPSSYRNLQTLSTHPHMNHHHFPINTTSSTPQQNSSHDLNPMPTPSTILMKNLKSQSTPRTWKNC